MARLIAAIAENEARRLENELRLAELEETERRGGGNGGGGKGRRKGRKRGGRGGQGA